MSDGHLYLGDDGVKFAGTIATTWYDESHGSVLALTGENPSQVVEISLAAHGLSTPTHTHFPPMLARSKSAPAIVLDATLERDETDHAHPVLFDFRANANTATTSPARGDIDTGSVVLMRLSLDRQFLAIQKSDVEVQIVRLATGESYWIVCKPKPGNRILSDGVVWNSHSASPQSSQDLFLVTRLGIEQYRVSPKRRSCALHRTIAVYVHTFWYSATHSVLIVSTGSRANEIVPFLMQGATVEKLPRLVFSSAVRKADLYLASLYDHLYAVYGDSKTTRLLLYRVTREKVSCVRSLHLMLPAGSLIEFSTVDNLLVCHSVDFSVALFFDIKCDSNTHDPFSHPLPVSLVQPAWHQPKQPLRKAASCINHERTSASDSTQLPQPCLNVATGVPGHVLDKIPSPRSAYSEQRVLSHMNLHDQSSLAGNGHTVSPWQFLSPDLALRSTPPNDPRSKSAHCVEIRRLYLNLEHVSRSCAQHPEILTFLLRRGDQQQAKRFALGLVRERLQEQALSPGIVAQILSSVQTVSGMELDRHGVRQTIGGGTSDESGNDTSSDDEYRSSFGTRAVVPLSLRKRLLRENSSDALPASIARIPSRNVNGMTMIFQSEFLQHLWLPLLKNPAACSTIPLTSYMSEFIRLLHQSNVPVETQTYTALTRAYILAGKTDQLYQVVQYHIFRDSTEVADLLIETAHNDLSLRQLAIDMYTRMGATTTVIQVLLDHGEVDEAIAISWRYLKAGTGDPSLVPGVLFFDAFVKSYSFTRGTSMMAIQQRLHSLLLFLRVWDNECLVGEPSPLAQTVTVSFPDEMIPESTRRKWRKGFGFLSA